MARGLHMSRSRLKALIKKAAKSKGKRAATPAIPKGPNANELRFNRMCLNGRGKYEPTKIIVTRTKRREYTPDFAYFTEDITKLAIVEVKGSYKLQSEDRARLAWEIAAETDSLEAVYVWARYRSGGYDCEAWFNRGNRIIKARVRNNTEFERMIYGQVDDTAA